MPKTIALSARLRSRLAVEPVILALVAAGGVGAYAFRNEPTTAAKPRETDAPRLAIAVGFVDEAGQLAPFAPVTAEPVRLQRVAFQPAVQLPLDSFSGAFRPLALREVVEPPANIPVAPVAEPAAVARDVPDQPAAMPESPPEPPVSAPVDEVPPATAEPVLAEPVPAAAAPEANAVAQVEPVVPAAEPEPVRIVEAPATTPAPAEPVVRIAALDVPVAPRVPTMPEAAQVVRVEQPAQLVPPPELPKAAPAAVSLATMAKPSAAAPLALASPPRPKAPVARKVAAPNKPALIAGPQIPSRYKVVDGGVETRIGIEFYGQPLGAVPLRVTGSGVPSLRLGDMLALLKDHMDPQSYNRLAGSAAAEEFVSLESLRKSGIPVRYDAIRDQLKLGEE